MPPYDKGSAIATLTAVMTEPLGDPKNAGPLKDVIYGLLTKDPAKRLDDAAARSMLSDVIHAPEPKETEEPDATKVVPLPAQPDAPSEAGERLRGALRSVRKAAAGAGAAAAASARAKSGGSASGGAASGGSAEVAGSESGSRAESGSGSGSAAGAASGGAAAGGGQAGGRSSGWPVMTPPDLPDLPPRPVPRAPLTDVVPRRTLVIIAVVVALAVIGVVLAFAFNGDDTKDSAGGGGAKASAKASASADTKEDESGGTRPDGQATASGEAGAGQTSGAEPSGGASASSGGGAGSDGSSGGDSGAVTTHQGGQGYSIGLPKGWKYQSSGDAGDRFTGPNGQKLLIGWTTQPKDDPVADWEKQEGAMLRSQYQRIRIEAVNYRGWNTADWEFTYVEGGTKYRSIDRGAVVDDDLGYGLMYTAKAANWGSELRKDTWRTLTKSFEPKA